MELISCGHLLASTNNLNKYDRDNKDINKVSKHSYPITDVTTF
jgi:hypothetical protein